MSSSTTTASVTQPKYLTLTFNNTALKELLMDEEEKNFTRQVKAAHFSRVSPTPVDNPRLVSCSETVLKDLFRAKAPSDFDDINTRAAYEQELATYFGGNAVLPGSEPAAHCYCGFQFGSFAGQLGDGRAMYLGEVNGYELQLKGAGVTPYSRSADGRAVLRSSIREFLCSEAMFALDIPTTRAATLVVADSQVVRDRNYDGNAEKEPMAIVCRVSPSFIRFGSFQICTESEDRKGPSVLLDKLVLPPLLDHVIKHNFQDIYSQKIDDSAKYVLYFEELVKRTAQTVALWQCVGFCHGVLNTDNLSAIGVTIDYGPFGFMERFDRSFVCNSSDNGARYSYEQQPAMCKWNLTQLADSLQEIIPLDVSKALIDQHYDSQYRLTYRTKMQQKLGLLLSASTESDAAPTDDDDALIAQLFDCMQQSNVDMTTTLRMLSSLAASDCQNGDDRFVDANAFVDKLVKMFGSAEERAMSFKPTVSENALRQYVMVAQAHPFALYQYGKSPEWLMKELDNRNKYLEFMKTPIDIEKEKTMWKNWIENYIAIVNQKFPEMSMEIIEKRVQFMNSQNPKYVLRNWVAEKAIRAAQDCGNFSLVNELLTILENPFIAHDPKYEEFCFPADLEMSESLAVS